MNWGNTTVHNPLIYEYEQLIVIILIFQSGSLPTPRLNHLIVFPSFKIDILGSLQGIK